MNTEPADRLSKETVEVRQGTGSRDGLSASLSRFWAQRLLARSSWDTSCSLIGQRFCSRFCVKYRTPGTGRS
jgi:hypothetical protein